jgi:acyl carrier protein
VADSPEGSDPTLDNPSEPPAGNAAESPESGFAWEALVKRLLDASDEELDGSTIGPDTRLKEDLGLGSLQAITLVMDLEEEYGMVVEDEELEGLVTVGDLRDLVASKLAAGESAPEPAGPSGQSS